MIIFSMIALLAYLAIGYTIASDALEKIEEYKSDTINQEQYVDISFSKKLEENKKSLVRFVFFGWPIYYLFIIGTHLGKKFYKTLFKEYEDRFAAWYI